MKYSRAGWAGALLIITLSTAAFAQSGKDKSGGGSPSPGATPTEIKFAASYGCLFSNEDEGANDSAQVEVDGIADLVEEYNQGQVKWADLQKDIRAVLATCGTFNLVTKKVDRQLGQLADKRLLVTFIVKDKAYQVLVPQAQPYSLVLTGDTSIIPVVLVASAAHQTKPPADFIFMSTRTEDPRVAQIPAFVKQIGAAVSTNLFAVTTNRSILSLLNDISGSGTALFAEETPPTPSIWSYTLAPSATLTLPFRRGSITETGTVTVNCKADSDELPECPTNKDKVDVSVSTTVTNSPLTRIDLTAVAGAVVGPFYKNQRMKLDNGKYASDPLKHDMTMAALAVHLKPYDSSLPAMTPAERCSWLIGGVLTPAAGVGTGLSVGLVRGFALNGGGVVLWIPTGANNAQTGDTAPTGGNQLPHRPTFGLFIGGNYTFGGGSGS